MATRDVVLIGGSLGGLEAVCSIVRGLPERFPGCVLVVLHTGPTSPGLLASIVEPFTSLNVAYAQSGDRIEHGRLFIAPAGRHLVVDENRRLRLEDGPKVRFSRPAVDRLFVSAAQALGPRVIGVVLTGGDHDGTDGLRTVGEAGGICIVQDPAEARDPSMPLNAIKGDHPHLVSPLADIPLLLASIVRDEAVGTGENH